MLSILDRAGRLCDGCSRRELLQVGSLGLFGLGLPQLLKGQTSADDEARPRPAWPRFRPGAVRDLIVSAGRSEPH